MNTITPSTRETVFGDINALTQAGTGSATQDTSGVDRLANKEVFLQLLVAQLKNQNPLNPADGTEFVAQLAQFTQLEQTMAMRQDLDKILTAVQTADNGNGEAKQAP